MKPQGRVVRLFSIPKPNTVVRLGSKCTYLIAASFLADGITEQSTVTLAIGEISEKGRTA
jgi:hypothetical protein